MVAIKWQPPLPARPTSFRAMEPPATPTPLTITREQINELELARFTHTAHVVTTPQAVDLAVRELMAEPVLGFDTESRPSFRKGESFPPSLIQLASSQAVYLFQLGRIGGFEGLVPLLEAGHILKAGVALHDDIRRLWQIHPFEPGGFVEISDLTRELGVEKTGLRSLAGLFLGVRISKGAQLSNWARPHLTQRQVAYAAADAWFSLQLYQRVKAIADGRASPLALREPPLAD